MPRRLTTLGVLTLMLLLFMTSWDQCFYSKATAGKTELPRTNTAADTALTADEEPIREGEFYMYRCSPADRAGGSDPGCHASD